MSNMFNNAIKFNGSIGNWNTSKVTNMNYMFYGAIKFNQPIGKWNTNNVEYANMFSVSMFNQSLVTSGNQWNVSKVINMEWMFYNATVFNRDISLGMLNPNVVLIVCFLMLD